MKSILGLIILNFISISLVAQVEGIWSLDFSLKPINYTKTSPKIKFDKEKNIIVVADNFVSKISKEGNLIWSDTLIGTVFHFHNTNQFDISQNGDIYVTSLKEIDVDHYATHHSIITTKFNSNGVRLWEREFVRDTLLNSDIPSGIAIVDADNICVAGTTNDSITNSDILVINYDSLGNLKWYRTHNDEDDNQADRSRNILIDSEKNILIGGRSRAQFNNEYYLVKYNKEGDFLWRTKYGFQSALKLLYDMVIDSENNIYLTGSDFTTVKIDKEGGLVWDHIIPSDFTSSGDMANVIKVDEEDNILVSGFRRHITDDGIDRNILTIKFRSDGKVLWENKFSRLPSSTQLGQDLWIEDETILVVGNSKEENSDYGFQLLSLNGKNGSTNFSFFPNNTNGRDDLLTSVIQEEKSIYVSGTEYLNGKNRVIVKRYDLYPLSLNPENSAHSLFLYPNPVQDILYCSCNSNNQDLKLDFFDISGKLVQSLKQNQKNNFSIDFLNEGIYFVKYNCKGKMIVQKIVKINQQ